MLNVHAQRRYVATSGAPGVRVSGDGSGIATGQVADSTATVGGQ
jgi:hypothetical protein